jgi:hypothetical protein
VIEKCRDVVVRAKRNNFVTSRRSSQAGDVLRWQNRYS